MLSTKNIAYLILLVLVIVLSFLGWSNLKGILFDDFNVVGILSVVGLFLLVMAVFGIIILVSDTWKMPMAAAGIILLTYILVFGFQWAYLAVFIVGLGLTLTGIAQALKEKNIHIKILPAQIAKPALMILLTVLAIAVAVAICFSPPAQGLKREIKIPRPLFDVIINSMSGLIDNQFQGLLTNPAGLVIPGLPQISGKEVKKAMGAGELNFDEILKPEDRDNLYQTLNQQMNLFIQPYKIYLPYGLAVAVFFLLQTIGFIFVLLAGFLTQALFLLLKSLKVINIKKEMVEKEAIEI